MPARIYRPARTATSSGTAKTRHWVLDFAPESAREVDPLMGWTSSADTLNQIRLSFDTREDAVAYAQREGLQYTVAPEHKRRVRPRNYADNFKPRPT